MGIQDTRKVGKSKSPYGREKPIALPAYQSKDKEG
jgi:hypothetical protein